MTPEGPVTAPALQRPRSAPHVMTLLVGAVALLASLVIYQQLWSDPFHHSLGGSHRAADPLQSMWNLKWVAWRVLHLHDPFTTRAIYYPDGASLSWNTLTPTLGVLAAPVTLTAGAVFAYTLLVTAAPVLASVTGFWWLRRHTGRPGGAMLGGLIIGFNPYMAGHMLGHLNLTFVAAVPVMLMLCEDLLWRRPRRQRRTAVYLGLVTAAQAGISEELILITAIGMLLALIVAAALNWTALSAALRSSWRAFALAVMVFVLVAAPLLVDQLFLSAHVPLHAGIYRADVGDYLVPLHRQLIDPNRPHLTYLGGAEDGVYLGALLIAVLVTGVALTVARDRAVRVAALTLSVLVLLTFGDSGPGGIAMPWRLFSRLPLLTSVLPARFSFVSWLLIAWLVSRWIDQLRRRPDEQRGRVTAWRGLALLGVALALVPVVPRMVSAGPVPTPVAFFTSGQVRSALHEGAPVLLLPTAGPGDVTGMYYQQQADFRFSQPGGYALRAAHDNAAYGPPDSALIRLTVRDASGAVLAADPDAILAGRRQLSAQHYQAIIVVRAAPDAARLAALAQLLAGGAPDQSVGGVWIWHLRA